MNTEHYFEEFPKWFESSSQFLSIWEGVCAVKAEKSLHFYKILDNTLLQFDATKWCDKELTSTGYWTCAEICGHFENGNNIFYHCPNANQAFQMLSLISSFYNLKISSIHVRFDPDPLREKRKKWISRRVKRWRLLGKKLQITDFSLLFDRNMPIG